jgi:ribosomal-protein-alanine N-acetyltransferase
VSRVHLERPSAHRERDFIDAALRSRALHRGRVIVAANAADYREYLGRTQHDDRASFFVVANDTHALAGVVEINDIVRAPEVIGSLAYYAFTPYAGSGLMREGLLLSIEIAFNELALDRLDANVQPTNHRSVALLERLGFERQGTQRRYKVGTRWLAHERWSLRAPYSAAGARA